MEPDWATHKVAEAAEAAGVKLDIRGGRHYTASRLLAGGDLRDTAARPGHSGGGATTLRHYADPVPEVDRRAAAYLAKLTADRRLRAAEPNGGAGRLVPRITKRGRCIGWRHRHRRAPPGSRAGPESTSRASDK